MLMWVLHQPLLLLWLGSSINANKSRLKTLHVLLLLFPVKGLGSILHCFCYHWRANHWPKVDNGEVFTFLYATKTSHDHFQSKNNLQRGKIKAIYNIIFLKQRIYHCSGRPRDKIKLTITALPAPYLTNDLNGSSLNVKAGKSDELQIKGKS